MPATRPAVPTAASIPPAVTSQPLPAPEPPEERAPFATDQVIAAFWFSAEPR